MTIIISGYFEFEHPGQVPDILKGAREHIEGALAEDGCIAYSWTEDHLTPGRVGFTKNGHPKIHLMHI